MSIGLIWAQARGGIIGAGGTMPWHLPEDLKHFQRTTQGAPVVMGRRTWESFPPRYRPLPGRTNIVITRREDLADAGAVRVASFEDALVAARTLHAEQRIWVIGGGAVYREAIDRADLLLVTEIDLEVAGDTTAPEIPDSFRLESSDPSEGWHEAASGLRYRILRYARTSPPSQEFAELQRRARAVRERYAEVETERHGRPWTREEIMLGFLGDVGDLAKLVQGKAGIRPRDDLDAALAHELADCLWSVLVLAEEYGVDLERAFTETMAGLEERLAEKAP